MSNVFDPTPDELAQWEAWVETRPPVVQELCRKFPPWKLYILLSSGHRVTIYSCCEDGTMTVNVTGQFNLVAFERRVFGIKPEDLVECDLPGPDEKLGSLGLDPEDVAKRFFEP